MVLVSSYRPARSWCHPNHKIHERGLGLLGKVAGRYVIELGVRPLEFEVTAIYEAEKFKDSQRLCLVYSRGLN